MLINRVIILIFSCTIQLTLSAQVIGRVIDSESGNAIAGANVVLLGTTSGTSTNPAGYFELTDLDKNATLVVSHVGYEAGEVTLGTIKNVLIKLSPRVLNIETPFFPINHISADCIVSSKDDSLTSFLIPEEEVVDEIFTIVESNASYRGGWDAFYKDLACSGIIEVIMSQDSSFNVQFLLKGDGVIDEVLVTNDSLKSPIQSILDKLNGWIPAIQGGKPTDQTISFKVIVDKEVFTIVEESASFPGGITQFYEHLKRELRYPREAQRMGVEGRVFVQFIVEKDGSLTDIHVVKGIGGGCDEEAVRVLKLSPKWIPGKQRGEPVRQKMIQNITFNIVDGGRGGRAFSSYPEFPGGREKLIEFVNKNKNVFDAQLPLNNLNNNVTVQFDIDSLGQTKNPQIISGLGNPFDQEAIRLINLMPKWIPARQGNKNIESSERVFINFVNLEGRVLQKAEAQNNKGAKYFADEKFEKAHEAFSKAIELNPTRLDYYFNRAISLIKLEKLEEACKDLTQIRNLDDQAKTWYMNYCNPNN